MKMVALLRGINVGGNRKVPMKELHSIAVKAGLQQVKTYINSGNLIFEVDKLSAADTTVLLEKAIQKHFGFAVDVVVRTEKQWKTYASKEPFTDAAKSRPNLLMIGLSKLPLPANIDSILSERAAANERIKIINDAIWIDFADGVARSKLTPTWINKAAGSPVTMRNWKTVMKLNEMLATE
ncbi:DUF1697 domain-containing protein [Bdellovibrio svalbardensis]|uniref:DUF1697 domain-containing protein n=1 Tax=Bdellovibrio svalbardensis TaxID=2972972 RepID=A0ABT6DHA7_9BACT|nr:DUF1697 domain-containing protein [Bdellovibrio svalbardensis]MDG0816251.1 DUF1697 domain-containing protein [Bdellovibrio svalbardensis]